MNKDTLNVSVDLEHKIFTQIKGVPERIYLLLHGYLLDGSYILKTLEDSIGINSFIIAPNGPFMVPVKKKDEYVPKFGWYFFDPHKKNYYIDFEAGANFLKKIMDHYNLNHLPVTIVGYSQGGYIAPKVAEIIPQVDTVIGMACTFRNNRFKVRGDVIYHQINSRGDLIVDIEGSREEFDKLAATNIKGEFREIKNSGHRIDEEYLKQFKMLI